MRVRSAVEMYRRRRSVGDPGATDRVVDSSRLDDRIDALKSRVGKILQRFERRVGREGASNSSGAGERRRRANTRLAQEIQGVRDEVAGMAERSDRMTESLRRIQRDIVASTRRRVPEAGNGSSLRRRPQVEGERSQVLRLRGSPPWLHPKSIRTSCRASYPPPAARRRRVHR